MTDHLATARAFLADQLATGALSVVPTASISALCDEVARLRGEVAAHRAHIGKTGRCSRCHQTAPNPNGCAICNVPRLTERVTEGEVAIREVASLRADAERWRKVAPLIERLADDVRRRELIARAEFDRRVSDTVTDLLAATRETTP